VAIWNRTSSKKTNISEANHLVEPAIAASITNSPALQFEPEPETGPATGEHSEQWVTHWKVLEPEKLKRQNLYEAQTTALINGPAQTDEKRRTYIIVGSGRGGTTMVAGVATILGLDLNPSGPGNLEDRSFVLVAQNRNPAPGHGREQLGLTREGIIERLTNSVRLRNKALDVWGWKDPTASSYLRDIFSRLRNPHIIMVWRDPAAVANANLAAVGGDPDQSFDTVLNNYMEYWRLIHELHCPTLMVSYERGRSKPSQLGAEMAEFLGMEMTPEKEATIKEFVSPTGGYLRTPGAPPPPSRSEVQNLLGSQSGPETTPTGTIS